MSQIERVPPSEVLQKPWLVGELPYFHDNWERYLTRLPPNVELVHHLGSRAYYETFQRSADLQKIHRIEELTMFAKFGTQPEEDIFLEAFERVKELCRANPDERYLHIRHDLEGAVEETWHNAPFRNIVGHSAHKIPMSQLETDYVEIEGGTMRQWMHVRDMYEAQQSTPPAGS